MSGLLGSKCRLGLLRHVTLHSILCGRSIYYDSSSVHAKLEYGQVFTPPRFNASN